MPGHVYSTFLPMTLRRPGVFTSDSTPSGWIVASLDSDALVLVGDGDGPVLAVSNGHGDAVAVGVVPAATGLGVACWDGRAAQPAMAASMATETAVVIAGRHR